MTIPHILHLRASDYPRMPWRNGGGVTTEVACNPGGGLQGFEWRLSIAQVGQDGPFSIFSGMQRIIAVLEGAGIEMTVDGVRQTPLRPRQPYAFSGDSQVQCRLLDGPIHDFNLIYSPSHYRARLQWLDGPLLQHFHSSAATVLIFNASERLRVEVDGQPDAFALARHDCLYIEKGIELAGYRLQAQTGVDACVIELQACPYAP